MSTPELSWGRSFFPYGSFSEVPTTAIRDALRQAFRRWGMPECLRVDNGNPWGNWNDLPTAFALWGWEFAGTGMSRAVPSKIEDRTVPGDGQALE